MKKIYKYNVSEFKNNPQLNFFDFVVNWEVDFNNQFKPYKANCLVSNLETMSLFETQPILGENENCGMDYINDVVFN